MCRGKLSYTWLTWIREADKKVTVKRALGKVWPPFIRWMAYKKISWPGMTKRSRTWADRWFAPAIKSWTSDYVCVFLLNKCKIGRCYLKPLVCTWTKENAARAVAPLSVFRNLSRWVIQMQTGRNTTRLDRDKVSSNTLTGKKSWGRVNSKVIFRTVITCKVGFGRPFDMWQGLPV